MHQRSQFNALTRGMVCSDECSELKTLPYHTEVAVCSERQGESNAAWKSSQLTLYLFQTTLGHAELRKQWEKRKIMSQTKSRVSSLCRVHSCCNIHKHKTPAENELLQDFLFFISLLFLSFLFSLECVQKIQSEY